MLECRVVWLEGVKKKRVEGVWSVWCQHGGMVERRWPAWPWQLSLPTVMHPGNRGQGLSPAVSTPIGFHGSSLISQICHCWGAFLLGALTHSGMVNRLQAAPYGYFSLSFCLCAFPNSYPTLCPALTLNLALRFTVPLSFNFFVSLPFVYDWDSTWAAG